MPPTRGVGSAYCTLIVTGVDSAPKRDPGSSIIRHWNTNEPGVGGAVTEKVNFFVWLK